ncbi:MAG TPA: UDP-N-acetylglucosamine 2-epimerase (non-hydrolyzing) [Candidatus Limnocylindria bacterium]|nr:UDP-N-acetylglucosamine 2-epimerase (non-hydrolyzing) [Candidatus Limnocylindria bacterium]
MTDPARVLVVLGTRPEAIKLAPVVNALRGRSAELEVRVCVTGQHREMLDPVLALFGIVPDHDLRLMRPDQTLPGLTGAVIGGVAAVLDSDRADWVIVQGDTTTALGAGLAAFYAGARLAHVEAGLRTADKHSPFPEEANRRIVDVLSDLHFAPTDRARENLLRECADPATVHVTGNTVIDALRYVAGRAYDFTTGPLAVIPLERRIVLVTAHRRESFGRGLIEIYAALRQLADEVDDIQIVYPVHMNPNVRETAYRELSGHPRISLIPPLDYASLVQLMRRSTLILTDSGGIQEEAPTFGKPVLVMRATTERPEAVEAGCARLVGTERSRIATEARRLLEDARAYHRMAKVTNPFGDGHASERITDLILSAGAIPARSRGRAAPPLASPATELSQAVP